MGFGFGGEKGAKEFANNFKDIFGNLNHRQIAIGTDINGLFPAPGPQVSASQLEQWTDNPSAYTFASRRQASEMIVYSDNVGASRESLKKCKTGKRSWDYSFEGFVHYGMFPDFLEDLHVRGHLATGHLTAFLNSAEYFARMWEKSENAAIRLSQPGNRWLEPMLNIMMS